MQEQPHYKITPDQGWARMKPILEEAMPVDRRQNRFGFFWWSTSTLILIGIVGLAFVKGVSFSGNPPAADNTAVQMPASEILQTSDVNLVAPAMPVETATQKDVEPSVNNALKTSNGFQPTAKSNTTSQENAAKSTPVPKNPSNKTVVPMALLDNPSALETATPRDIHGGFHIDAVPIQMKTVTDARTIEVADVSIVSMRNTQVVETLPMLNEVAFAEPGYTPGIIPGGTATKGKRNPRFLEPGLVISGLAGPDGALGAYGGAGLNMNVSRRFSVTTDFGFLSYSPNASFLRGLKSLDSNAEYNSIINYDPSYTGNETYVDAGSINKEAGYNVINPLIDRVTQWQAAVGMKWKCTTRFYLDGGVRIGFNTRGYSEYPIVSTSQTGTSFPIVNFQNSLNAFNVMRSTTTSVYAGLGYRLGKHIEVFSNWSHAFDEYLLSDQPSATVDQASGNRTDYISGLSLGLRYTL